MRRIDRSIAVNKIKLKTIANKFISKSYNSARINHKHKLIFIHIPKTAGNSITKELKLIKNLNKKTPKISKHAKAFEVKYLIGEKIWNDYFSFAFVRNPWDLMVSSYHWWLQKAQTIKYHKKKADKISNFSSFKDFLYSDFGKYMINERYGDMFDWICDFNDNIIVDYVGKLETINEDWKNICKLTNINYRELPHINSSNRDDYRNYYDDDTIELIRKRFHKTINQYNYEF